MKQTVKQVFIQAWSIFRQDISNIKRVPLMGLLLIGLAFLPSLYAWVNLSASWDPYSNTSQIKIAVVNEDQGAEVRGELVNIGNQLVENLKKNDALGWVFVPRDEADRGVRYGDYYASVYIGPSFSEDLSAVVKGDPHAAEVRYLVNEKLNAIAPKMTSAGANAIVQQISEQFIGEATTALFTELNTIGIKLEEELPTIRRLENNIYKLEDYFPKINEVGAAIIEIDANWASIEEKANKFLQFKEFIPRLNEGAQHILVLEEHLPQINKLGEKVVELEQAIPVIEKTADDIPLMQERMANISGQLDKALQGVQTAGQAIDKAQSILPMIENTALTAEEHVQALTAFMDRVQEATEPLLQIIMQNIVMIEETAATVDDILQRVENSDTPENIIDILAVANTQLIRGSALLDHAINMFTAINNYSESDVLQPVITRFTEMKTRVDELQQDVGSIVDTGNIAIGSIPAIRQKTQRVQQVASGLDQYLNHGGAEQISGALQSMKEKLLQANNIVQKLNQHWPDIENMLINAKNITDLGEERIKELIATIPQIEKHLEELDTRIKKDLPLVIDMLTKLSQFVQVDLPALEEKIHLVSDFIRNDLPRIEQEYDNIAGLLSEYLPIMRQSINDMAQFAQVQLPELEKKVANLADWMRQFDKEHDLAELVSLLKNDIEKESEFFKEPVHLVQESIFPIPNYGSANAPFYTALCLWVGALLLSNLVSTNVHQKDMRPEYTLEHVYLGRMILFLFIGILQALIVSFGNLFLLLAYAAHPFLFVVFTVLIAIVFMTIVYTFASVLGNIGKAFAVILMVLQLSGAGGTFPIQVAPPFFQAIHPFLPFTYAINLLREAVGGIVPSITWTQIGVLLGFWVVALTLGLLLKKPLDKRIRHTAEKSKSSRLME